MSSKAMKSLHKVYQAVPCMLEFSRLQGCNGINPLIVISSNFKELLIDGPRESFSSTWFVMAILTPN